jgi:hypothetical protein
MSERAIWERFPVKPFMFSTVFLLNVRIYKWDEEFQFEYKVN